MAEILELHRMQRLPNVILLGRGVFKHEIIEQAIRKMSDEGYEYDPASGRFFKRMGSRYIEWVEITGKDDTK
jgi:hypothetical protein